MNKELSYLVSNVDLEKKFKTEMSHVKIMVYPELNQIKTISELLPENICCCFILLKTSDSSGHWTSLSRNQNNIYNFDSYGVKADGELSHISSNLRYELHENTKSLNRIIKTIPKGFTFSFNNMQLQAYNENIHTCGKWNYAFCKCIMLGLTLSEFQQRMRELKVTYKTSYDDLVCVLWKSL